MVNLHKANMVSINRAIMIIVPKHANTTPDASQDNYCNSSNNWSFTCRKVKNSPITLPMENKKSDPDG
jgi:hypothetical protein